MSQEPPGGIALPPYLTGFHPMSINGSVIGTFFNGDLCGECGAIYEVTP